MKNRRNKRGQAMVEYIIIVVLVAIAALAVFAVFSDTLRNKLSGAVSQMDSGTQASEAQAAAGVKSQDTLKKLQADGTSQ
ncbi:MAG: Flp family type IVb pilin [Verrucomicrobia bacterium]|nr:MAG: Flp family type IVb pilin [Verrucomicrobiota bacterium]